MTDSHANKPKRVLTEEQKASLMKAPVMVRSKPLVLPSNIVAQSATAQTLTNKQSDTTTDANADEKQTKPAHVEPSTSISKIAAKKRRKHKKNKSSKTQDQVNIQKKLIEANLTQEEKRKQELREKLQDRIRSARGGIPNPTTMARNMMSQMDFSNPEAMQANFSQLASSSGVEMPNVANLMNMQAQAQTSQQSSFSLPSIDDTPSDNVASVADMKNMLSQLGRKQRRKTQQAMSKFK